MNKIFFNFIIGTIFSASVLFVSCNNKQNKRLTVVAKPDVSDIPIVSPRKTNIIPEGYKNIPFVDSSSVPIPTPKEEQYGFILFSRPITQPVHKNYHPRTFERTQALSAFATTGEYEPFTFSVYPLRDMKNFKVIVSDLKSDYGVIKGDNIDLRLVTNWNVRYPKYTSVGTYREVPELLEKVTVNSFKKGENQRYWITVHIPENAAEGVYSGSVTMFDDIYGKAVRIPVSLRVLPYKLIKDSQKHFTSFMLPYSHLYRGFEPDTSLVMKAIKADFANMKKYGFDLFPDFYLRSREGKNGKVEFYIKPEDELMIDIAFQLGFEGDVILVGGWNYFMTKYHPECKSVGGHGKLNMYPPATSKMFGAITEATGKFTKQCRDKGWPELIYFVADEPRGDNAEFMSRVYNSFKKGGAVTLLSNDPTSGYAHYYHDKNCVDIWMSQPFDIPYNEVLADKTHQYWSYPNHNAGEFKDRVFQQKGGRMTYGFGLWKSGYNTLMPWAWRWFVKGNHHYDHFDYLFEGAYASGCGMRIDEQANFIPAIYWECFREGYDDGRYLYTLQQTIKEREEAEDRDCQLLVAEGKQLLDSIWKVIEPQKKYMSVDFMDDRSFNKIRWQIASVTMQLMKYDAVTTETAPSVIANTTLNTDVVDDTYFINKARKENVVQYFDMTENSFKTWNSNADKEMNFFIEENSDGNAMVLNVTVDKKHDGINSTNKYPVGWPLVHYTLKDKDISISNYDYLTFKVKFESNRDNVTTDVASYSITPVKIVFKKPKGESSVVLNLGGNENIWQTIQIPLTQNMANAEDIAILIYEGDYPEHTNVKFTIPKIGLFKFTSPYIKQIINPNPVLTTDNQLVVELDGFSFNKDADENYKCKIVLKDRNQKVISEKVKTLTDNFYAVLELHDIKQGNYSLSAEIYDNTGKLSTSESTTVRVIKGYLD